ncbi:MAG: hypothetical protein FWJ59_01070 [Caldicoprobacter sp.]|uniref:CD1247 N-terminal domain-containing protein n=1 Tax=Caldicoprobacter sp. TaxID=2004500 RepID=UPI0039C43B62
MNNNLGEKMSYIKGLAEGLGLHKEDTKEARILMNIIELLEDIVDAINELETSQAEQDDYLDALNEDLTDIQNDIYGEDEGEDMDEDAHYVEVVCPHCQETVYFEEEAFEEEDDLICPNCGKLIYQEEDDDEYDQDENEE